MNLQGRENQQKNDLFFVCALIEFIARRTKNMRSHLTQAIGRDGLAHLLEFADVYHCENIEKLADEIAEQYAIGVGTFDNVAHCQYAIPTHWDIGKVYKRLIARVATTKSISYLDALIEIYASPFAMSIDDYNSSLYYENEDYLFHSYQHGEALPA